jgi:hypothetical protein
MFAFAGMQVGGVPTCYTEDRTTYADSDWNLRVIQSEARTCLRNNAPCTNAKRIEANKRRIYGQKHSKNDSTKKLRILAERLQDARRAGSRLAIADVSLKIELLTNSLNTATTDIEELTAANNLLETLPKKDVHTAREVLHLVKKFQSTQATHHK